VEFFEIKAIQLETSIFDPPKYGCDMMILYDKTVNDIIFHDVSNTTWNSIARVYGTFDHSFYLEVSLKCSKNLTFIGSSYMCREKTSDSRDNS
jgi:hypothetical protein